LKSTHKEMFRDLSLPSDIELQNLEDLVAALRPVEKLTSLLCRANFDVLKVVILNLTVLARVLNRHPFHADPDLGF
jgi:hypothetical protein